MLHFISLKWQNQIQCSTKLGKDYGVYAIIYSFRLKYFKHKLATLSILLN